MIYVFLQEILSRTRVVTVDHTKRPTWLVIQEKSFARNLGTFKSRNSLRISQHTPHAPNLETFANLRAPHTQNLETFANLRPRSRNFEHLTPNLKRVPNLGPNLWIFGRRVSSVSVLVCRPVGLSITSNSNTLLFAVCFILLQFLFPLLSSSFSFLFPLCQ